MQTRVVILSDNTVAMKPGLLAEHGFAAYIEAGDRKLLFDSGQSNSAAHNAKLLNIDLTSVPLALSHGHYDHAGGLRDILSTFGGRKIFCHPDSFMPKYIEMNGNTKFIGMPQKRQELESIGACFDVSREARQIMDGIWLTGEIPRITQFEKPEGNLLVIDPVLRIDPLLDDQALVLHIDKGLLIILGCAHSGIINTIEHAKRMTGEEKIAGIIGGTHLGFPGGNKASGDIRLSETIHALERCEIGLLAASHCTGQQAAAKLYAVFGERFIFNNAGTVIEL